MTATATREKELARASHLPPGTTSATARAVIAEPHPVFEPPEDRSTSLLSGLGDIEYVQDFVRPGRIVVVAAEEGSGKTFAFPGEMGIRLALANVLDPETNLFAGTWAIKQGGPILYLSEMHSDEDHAREEMILTSLGRTRTDLAGRYFRQSLDTGAGGEPVLDSEYWRDSIIAWATEMHPVAMFIDTATMATDSEPWGMEMRTVIRNLRLIQKAIPELAIVVLVHFKKPQGRTDTTRGLSSVMGEWGRPTDVIALLQNNGPNGVKLSTHKRVTNQRRISVTKSGGLLIDPVLIDGTNNAPKISLEGFIAAVQENPGLSQGKLAEYLEVSASTVADYITRAGDAIATEKGERGSKLIFPTGTAPVQGQFENLETLAEEFNS